MSARPRVERYSIRSSLRVAYVFVTPLVIVVTVYLIAFLGLNSRRGSEWLASLISSALTGEMEYATVVLGPSLQQVDLFDTRIRDLQGHVVVRLEHTRCVWAPSSLVDLRLQFSSCLGRNGELLILEDASGDFGFVRAFRGPVRPKRRGVRHPHLVFEDITLEQIDVVIVLDDMMVRMDGVDVRNGRIESGRVPTDMRADATWDSGRVLMSERMFGMGDGKSSWDDAAFEARRRVRPRWAVRATLPTDADGRASWVDVPLAAGSIRDFVWYLDDFRFGAIALNAPSAGARFEASGWLRLLPERPEVAPREQAGLMFDGRLVASIAADSTILEFFLPGMIRPSKTLDEGRRGLEPLVFDGAGNLHFYEGADTRIRATEVEILGVAVPAMDLGVGWDQGRVELRPDSRVEVAGGVLTGSGWLRPRDGRWSLDLCVEDVDLSQLLAGRVDPESDAMQWLRATVQTTPARCLPDAAGGLALGGRLTRKGLFEVAPGATTPVGTELPEPPLTVAASGLRLRWPGEGPLPSRRVDIDVNAELDLRGRVTPGAGAIEGLRIVAGGATLGWSGGLDLVEQAWIPGRLRVSARRFDRWLHAFGAPSTDTALSIEVSADVSGPLDAPVPRDIRLRLDHPEADSVAPDFDLEARLDVVDDRLIVRDGALTSTLGRARIGGSVGVFDGSIFATRRDPSLDLDVDLDGVRVGAFARSLGPGALLDTAISVSGSVGAPRLEGDRLLLLDATLGPETFEIVQTGPWFFDDGGLSVDAIQVNRGKGNASGRLAWDAESGALEIDASGRGFQLRELRTVAESGVDARGEAQFELSVRGALQRSDAAPEVDIEGSLVLDDLVVDRVRVGGVALTFDTWDGTMHVAGAVAGDLDVDARVPLSEDGTLGFAAAPIEGRVRARGLRLEDHWPRSRDIVDRSSLTGGIDVRVDPATGEMLARLSMDEMTVQIDDRDFGAARPLHARLLVDADGAWRILLDDVALGTGERVVTVDGQVSSGDDGPRLALTAGGELDASLLRFVPDLITDAEGVAALALKVNGPLTGPVLVGRADHGRVRIVPRGLGTSIDLEPGTLLLSTDAITFDRDAPLRGTLFGGEFTAFGELGLTGLVPSSVDLSALVTQLSYRIPEQLNTTLTGQIRFIAESLADFDTWSVAGDIELVDARFYRDFDVVADQFAFGGVGRSVDAFALPIWLSEPAIGRMQADLTVTGRDRFFVESRVANVEMDVELRTDLTVGGRFEAMEVRGEMEALSGSRVTYRGRTFSVEEARLLLRGERDPFGYPIPWLDAELTASIRPCVRRQRDAFDLTNTGVGGPEVEDVFVTAWVEGPLPYELTFRLESTPFYDQRDQLSLILTGCTVDELTAASAGAPTLDLVLRPVVELVERNVEERLDFDDVDLTPTTEGSAGIVIQDEVTERFTWTLDATVGTGEQSRQIVRGEYRVFDWLILEVQEQTSPEENIQIDTGIRFRFTLD